MKKFKFKLQTVLDQRESREDRLLAELGDLRREEAEEMRCLDRLVAQLIDARAATVAAMGKNAPPDELARHDEYAKMVRDDVKVQELTIEAIRARVETKRLEVIEAMKQRQVLEALRDKQESAYIQAGARAEQNEADAMASLRYARGM